MYSSYPTQLGKLTQRENLMNKIIQVIVITTSLMNVQFACADTLKPKDNAIPTADREKEVNKPHAHKTETAAEKSKPSPSASTWIPQGGDTRTNTTEHFTVCDSKSFLCKE